MLHKRLTEPRSAAPPGRSGDIPRDRSSRSSPWDACDSSGRGSAVHRRSRLVKRTLLVTDVAGVSLAFALSQTALAPAGAPIDLWLFVATLPAWVFAAWLYGLYSNDVWQADHSTVDDIVGVV